MMRKIGWAFLALVLLAVFGFSWAPFGIKSYVEKHYPGVKVGTVLVRWGFLAFKGVSVDRPGVKGSLTWVLVDWDKNIKVHGGHLTVEPDELEKKPKGGESKSSLEGTDLRVTVKKGDAEGLLEDTRFDAKEVCFKTGSFSYKSNKATVTEGCVSRGDHQVRAKHVEVPFELPFELPRIEKQQVLKIDGVKVNPNKLSVSFEAASLLPFFKTDGPSTAHLTPEKTLFFATDRLEVNHPWMSPEPVVFSHVWLSTSPGIMDGHGVITVGVGPVTVSVEPWTMHIMGRDTCDKWVEAMPTPLPEALDQAKGHFSGELSFEVKREPSPHFSVKNTCKFECSAEPIKSIRSGRIKYMAYDKDDKLFERVIGPGTKDWVPIAILPPHVPKAFITMEDPGFLGHRGIIPQALENSLKDNLKLGKFFRGGSTISMQLAKNLWLRRHKTLGRKTQEALLTTALESCLSKDQILELYLNAVEMGPNLYGIGAAAKHYFDKEANRLEPEEAFYLASILPHPRKAIPPASGGLERTRSLMRTLADRGFISDALVPLREDEVDSSGWETE